jgi:hypothetical protein
MVLPFRADAGIAIRDPRRRSPVSRCPELDNLGNVLSGLRNRLSSRESERAIFAN